MTQERLRELLRERVAEETMPDRSALAWQRAAVVRRRRRLAVVGGVAAASVAVSVGIAAVDSTPAPDRREPGLSDVGTPSAAPASDATYDGVPVWWSPDQVEERSLAPIGSLLPAEIDLDRSTPYVAGELDHALAAFARGRSAVLVGPAGELRTVDLTGLQEVTKPNGYSYFPTTAWMLTADGRRLAIAQPDHDAVLDIASGEWSSAPPGSAVLKGGSPRPLPFDTSPAQRYGAGHDGAASWGMGLRLPVGDPGTDLPGPEFMLVNQEGFWPDPRPEALLAFMDRSTDGQDSRWKNCCPVAGWLDADWVVYESRQATPLLVAWRLGTSEFRLVSRILGAYDVASFSGPQL